MSAGAEGVPLGSVRYRKAPYPEPQLAVERRADGTLLLSSPIAFAPPQVKCVSEYLPLWAAARPEVPMFCQRGADGAWRRVTYRDLWQTVRAALAQRLTQAHAAGASQRIERVLLMAEPPSIDANEIADKGYVNQAATRARRAALVEELYHEPPAAHIACARPPST